MLVPKLLLTPLKIRIFGPKTAKIGPKYAFLVIFGQILAFLAQYVLTKNNANIIWVPNLSFSPVRIRIFVQKRSNLARNWHFWSFWARPCQMPALLVGGLVGGCGARAVSR